MPTTDQALEPAAVIQAAMQVAKMYCDRVRASVQLHPNEQAAYDSALACFVRYMQ